MNEPIDDSKSRHTLDLRESVQSPVAPEPTPIPPASPAPKPKRRVKRAFKVLIWLIIIAGLAYTGLIIKNVVNISTQPLSLQGLSTDSSGRTNILIMGEGDAGHAGAGLTDTMMLFSLNTRTNQIAQVSIPRDLRVNIPGYGFAKINAAHAYGGAQLAEQTVSNTLDVPINYYVVTNFDGLKTVVDAVGGLDINVKTALIDSDYPCDDNQYQACGLSIAAGQQHMDGATVLKYTRCRKGTCGNDFGRAARQQEVLTLLRQKALAPSILFNPIRLAKLTSAIKAAVTTNMGTTALVQFGLNWKQSQSHEPIRLVFSTGPGGYLVSSGSSDLLPADGSFKAMSERVNNIFIDPVKDTDIPKS